MDKFPFDALMEFLAAFVKKLIGIYNDIIGFMNKEYDKEDSQISGE